VVVEEPDPDRWTPVMVVVPGPDGPRVLVVEGPVEPLEAVGNDVGVAMGRVAVVVVGGAVVVVVVVVVEVLVVVTTVRFGLLTAVLSGGLK
jgi:hypothetical protein